MEKMNGGEKLILNQLKSGRGLLRATGPIQQSDWTSSCSLQLY